MILVKDVDEKKYVGGVCWWCQKLNVCWWILFFILVKLPTCNFNEIISYIFTNTLIHQHTLDQHHRTLRAVCWWKVSHWSSIGTACYFSYNLKTWLKICHRLQLFFPFSKSSLMINVCRFCVSNLYFGSWQIFNGNLFIISSSWMRRLLFKNSAFSKLS